ncbi:MULTISPECIES: ANTAR domain-containing protein [unclassified Streptomyces]|uniref:ANTAR domain-containing protein n=1 Tax=unclassified Streptomyces TaxID=2593676 RepID=UPI003433B644
MLARRYRLECADAAFELLKTSSQRSDVKLHTLADAVVRTAAPDRDATPWFPGRARFGPPRLPGAPPGSGRARQPGCRVLGMISSHHERPLTGFSRPRLTVLHTSTPKRSAPAAAPLREAAAPAGPARDILASNSKQEYCRHQLLRIRSTLGDWRRREAR